MLSDHCSTDFDRITNPWHPWGAGLLRPNPKPRLVGKVNSLQSGWDWAQSLSKDFKGRRVGL